MFATIETLAIYMPGWPEMMVIGLIALLIFGKRLPEVGKSMGKGIVEFKKGLKGLKEEVDEINNEVEDASNRSDDPDGETRQLGDSAQANEAGSTAAPATDQPHRDKAQVSS